MGSPRKEEVEVMAFRYLLLCLLAAVLVPEVAPAQVADMTSNWILNKKRSSWGSPGRPFDVILRIEHREPRLKYNGTITYDGDNSREFAYDGVIDGQPRAADRPAGSGTMTHQRIGPLEFKTEFRTASGQYVQTVSTVISRDGKTLTRSLRIETQEGVHRWTEVYDKK